MRLPDPREGARFGRAVEQELSRLDRDKLGYDVSFKRRSCQSGVTALGTNQATAQAIVADLVEIGTAAASTGVRLPSAAEGMQKCLANIAANAVSVYPASGDQIDALGTNTAFSLGTAARVILFAPKAGQWYSK